MLLEIFPSSLTSVNNQLEQSIPHILHGWHLNARES